MPNNIVFNCPHCGLKITTPDTMGGDALDCPKCGRAMRVPPATIPLSPTMPTQPESLPLDEDGEKSLTCPRCRRIDLVRKVTSIVSQETTTGSTNMQSSSVGIGSVGGRLAVGGASSSSTSAHYSQTELAKRLAPPLPPPTAKKSTTRQEFRGGIILSVFFLIGTLSNSYGYGRPLVCAGLTVILAAVSFFLWKKIPDADRKDQKFEAIWQEDEDAWKKLMKFWKQAFYCLRCDGVFKPGDSKIQSPDIWR